MLLLLAGVSRRNCTTARFAGEGLLRHEDVEAGGTSDSMALLLLPDVWVVLRLSSHMHGGRGKG